MKKRLNQSSPFKIGFYIRVSTEEQARNLEGSIKNQEERLKTQVHAKNKDSNFGQVVETFIDRAKSGKDTKRPALQKMLTAIQNGDINLVMSSELSRISRSIKDFSQIWDLMQKHGCGFLSLRENFDSTNAAGEMLLFSMANLAQFERRQVSERVSANIKARAMRGLYNGGSVPFGYQLIPDKPGYLEVNSEAAVIVKKAYEVFLLKGSVQPTARWLNENGYRLKRKLSGGGRNMRLGQFTVDNLYHILRNKMYAGLKTYKEDGEEKSVTAVWKPIVSKDLFKRAQKKLTENRSRLKPQSFKKHPYLVTGITYCSDCKTRLSGKSAHGSTKKFPYYEHSWQTKRGATLSKELLECNNKKRFPANKLEDLILEKIKTLMNDASFSKNLFEKALKVHRKNKGNKVEASMKAKVYGFSSQLDALAERLAELPKSISAGPIYKQMERIEGLKKITEEELSELKESGGASQESPVELKSYQKFLSSLTKIINSQDHELRGKIIKRLIHRVDVGNEEVTIHYKLGHNSLLREPIDLGSRLFLCSKSSQVRDLDIKKGDKEKNPVADSHLFKRNGSQSLTNGARGQT